ncbi:hypothetical protein M3Y94_01205500 [Aphelenchoides besseyi]|nr:hypothetical protein M3Y94_01205500 [Aphelenchoides besseyi]KAI6228477.1 hypothetical protein M3Y95_00626400 [Aphelenchoides besseyi]
MYRQQILERLKERDRRTAQFVRLISALTVQSELLNFILNERPLNRTQQRTLSECATTVEIDALNHELAKVYKAKFINDQKLVDVQTEIAKKEIEIISITTRNNQMEQQVALAINTLQTRTTQIEELRASKTELQNELAVVEESYKHLKAQLDSARREVENVHREEEELIETLKSIKQSQVDLLNEHNDLEYQKQEDRLRAELADAMANLYD